MWGEEQWGLFPWGDYPVVGTVNQTRVDRYGLFEIISQDTSNNFLINTGIGYDGYGNRICQKERFYGQLYSAGGGWPSGSFPSDSTGTFGFLCVGVNPQPLYIDYQDHPYYGTSMPTKQIYQPIFYIAPAVIQVNYTSTTISYYPTTDYAANQSTIIHGLALGKVYDSAIGAPDVRYRSCAIAVKDGVNIAV